MAEVVAAAEAEAVVTIPDVIESASRIPVRSTTDNKPKNPTDLGAWFSSHAPEVISFLPRSARRPGNTCGDRSVERETCLASTVNVAAGNAAQILSIDQSA